MTIVIWGNETMDISGELLAQSLDGEFTKDSHTDQVSPTATVIRDSETNVIFYGIVKTPDWFDFNEDRMFCNPVNSRKLLKRREVLATLSKQGFETIRYYPVKDVSYTRMRDVLGAKFDVVSKSGMRVVGTVKNASEYNKLKGKFNFASKHISNTTKKYRVYLGHPDVTPVIGASVSEHRTLSFKEALMFNSTEETKVQVENWFEAGLLSEDMGEGFKAWTEETHLNGGALKDSPDMDTLKKLSKTIHKLYETDFCAIDIIVADNKSIITNITACPSLQADDVLTFVSEYFKKIVEEGRKITPEHIKRLVEGMNQNQLDVVAELFKKALSSEAS